MRVLVLLIAIVSLSTPAAAVTVRDIIELTRAGLSDEVLVAVIDADRTVFTLDAGQILELKRAGVSETVLVKMLRTRVEFDAREDAAPRETQPETPGLVIIGAHPAAPSPPVTVVVPYYVAVPIWGVPARPVRPGPSAPFLPEQHRGFGRFINDGWIDRR